MPKFRVHFKPVDVTADTEALAVVEALKQPMEAVHVYNLDTNEDLKNVGKKSNA